jgi:Uncharacterized protein conserved in bacteria (DUF2062).
MMAGGLVLAVPLAVLAYYAAYRAIEAYRKRRKAHCAKTGNPAGIP